MKKLCTIAMMILALNVSSQVHPPGGTVQIINTDPREMCDHDSMQVNFKFFFSGNPDTIQKHTLYVWKSPFGFFLIGHFKYTDFFYMIKNLVGADTIYSFKFFYSSTAGTSYHGMSINYPLGHHAVCTSGQLSCVTTHVFYCDFTTGIRESLSDANKPIYFDLYGNMIEPRQGEIMIEKVGNRRRKVLIN